MSLLIMLPWSSVTNYTVSARNKNYKEALLTILVGVNMAGGVTSLEPGKPAEAGNSVGNGLPSKAVLPEIMLPLC
jgi:hypothetical protein